MALTKLVDALRALSASASATDTATGTDADACRAERAPYRDEGELVAAIVKVAESAGWAVAGQEWGVPGFPELGAGDLAFESAAHAGVAVVVEAKLVQKRPSNQHQVEDQAAYYGRMWARLHPNTYVVCVACTDVGTTTVPILSQRRFAVDASQRLTTAHDAQRQPHSASVMLSCTPSRSCQHG